MSLIGRVESLWRYPVKSMRGEELQQAYVGFGGIYGDRIYAFHDSVAKKGFPYLTAREQEAMLLYRPRFRHPEHSTQPPNLKDAEVLGPGVTPVYPNAADLIVDVEVPSGDVVAIDDEGLVSWLLDGLRDGHELTLMRSDRAMTDCRPISLFSIQTARQLGEETHMEMDKCRFRANIYVDLEGRGGFGEDEFVGRTLRVGSKVMIAVTDRDPRCKMITLDPDTAEASPQIMRQVAHLHGGTVGVYGAVLVEGIIRPGDEIVFAN